MRGVVPVVLASALVALAPSMALADEPVRIHGELGASHAMTAPQSRELGFGGAAAVSLELPFTAHVGLEGKLTGMILSAGDPPRDPSFAPRGTGTIGLASLGFRARPFGEVAGPWASASVGYVQTGSAGRFGFDANVGWDVRVRGGRWDVGPYLGWMQVVQPEDTLRPEDARIVSLGIHVGLGRPEKAPVREEPIAPPRGDRDLDGVFDDEDACPDVPGIRTNDPKTNGCPRPDRDGDAVFDDEDVCPDVPGIRTNDPKTNGCPRADRDGDTVFDDEDACPDLAGVRTTDPKTNGCPEAQGDIRAENERIVLDDVILFDVDSPRVRSRSWPLVQRLAKFIKTNPDILEVSIEGHADATGTEEHNLMLSRDRAESVKRLLVRYGVDAGRLKAEAFGRSRLRVQTQAPEAKNRRVEFWITRTKSKTTNGGALIP